MKPLQVVVAIVAAMLVVAPAAHAAMGMGDYDLFITGRNDFHSWTWYITPCGDGCLNVEAKGRPVALAFQYDGQAQLVDGRWTMAVDVPDGLRCGHVMWVT